MNSSQVDTLVPFIQSLQKSIMFYWTLSAFNLGFLLNILLVAVYMRKVFRGNPTAVYTIFIAIAGNVYIVLMYFNFFPQAYSVNYAATSDLSCKLNSFLLRVFPHLISWLNVMMSVDRMTSVLYPNLYLLVKTNKFICLASVCVFIALCMVNSINLWFKVMIVQRIFNPATNSTLVIRDCTSEGLTQTRDLIGIVMRTLLPFTCMFVSNTALIVGLWRQKRRMLNMTRSLMREFNFCVSVLAQNGLFILSLAPHSAAVIFQYTFIYYTSSTANNSTRMFALINLAVICGICLSTYTVGYTFVVNLVFNRLFRKEFGLIVNGVFYRVGCVRKIIKVGGLSSLSRRNRLVVRMSTLAQSEKQQNSQMNREENLAK